jgi:hypothetical protein
MDDLFRDKFRKLLRQSPKVHEALLKDLDEILSHIEDRYNKYFNLDEKVPGVYLVVSQNDLKNRIKDVKKGLSPGSSESLVSKLTLPLQIPPPFGVLPLIKGEKGEMATQVDGSLLKMVLDSLNSFIRQDGNVSYRQLIYMKELVKELEELVESPDFANAKSAPFDKGGQAHALLQVLMYMNFNSSSMASYLIGEIVDTINALHEPHEKRERLAQYYKEYNQMQVKPGVAFKPRCKPLKEQLNSWLEDEMDYVEQKQRLFSVVPVMKDDFIMPDEEKMHFSTSVEVLSLFIRSCMDTKFVLNKQKTPMLKAVVKFMRTVEQENLSYKSMRNSWYTADKGNKEKLKSILMEMYKVVHRY